MCDTVWISPQSHSSLSVKPICCGTHYSGPDLSCVRVSTKQAWRTSHPAVFAVWTTPVEISPITAPNHQLKSPVTISSCSNSYPMCAVEVSDSSRCCRSSASRTGSGSEHPHQYSIIWPPTRRSSTWRVAVHRTEHHSLDESFVVDCTDVAENLTFLCFHQVHYRPLSCHHAFPGERASERSRCTEPRLRWYRHVPARPSIRWRCVDRALGSAVLSSSHLWLCCCLYLSSRLSIFVYSVSTLKWTANYRGRGVVDGW